LNRFGRLAPRIAVIIPCLNDGAFLPAAVRSIEEEEPIERVVVDDASSEEGTLEYLRDLESDGVRVVRHAQNRGLAAARRTGLRATHAPYVFNLDADDVAVSGSLAVMANRLDEDSDAAACISDYIEFGERDGIRLVTRWLDPYRVAYNNEWPVSALFRRTVLESVGGWQDPCEEAAGYEDWDLWMTLAERGLKVVFVGDGIFAFRKRLHPGRMHSAALERQRVLYVALRRRHQRLFAELPAYRRQSDLSPLHKWLYPVMYYGGRPRLAGLRTLLRPFLGRHRERR
jgi:glycosyltransferase involved in cell wall biosynthesis